MKTMAIDGHCRGSKIRHNRGNKDAKKNGKKRMSQEEYEREMYELKKRLNVVQMLLQGKIAENQKQ
jgi:hypothetical protein